MLQRLSLSEDDHHLRGLPLSPLLAFVSGRQGASIRARHRRQSRNGKGVVRSVRADLAEALKHRKPKRGRVWHLDEMRVVVDGVVHWLWRAINEHGEVMDVLLQENRDQGYRHLPKVRQERTKV